MRYNSLCSDVEHCRSERLLDLRAAQIELSRVSWNFLNKACCIWCRCQIIFVEFANTRKICDKKYPMFARGGTTSQHVDFLGDATVRCHGYGDLYVLLSACTSPCVSDLNGCCWVPPVVSSKFACCSELHCCPNQVSVRTTRAHSRRSETLKSVLASTSNVLKIVLDAQNHVGRAEEIRNRAFSHPK